MSSTDEAERRAGDQDGTADGGRRAAVTAARRIVVKVGSSSLTTAAGGLDGNRVDALVDALCENVLNRPDRLDRPDRPDRPDRLNRPDHPDRPNRQHADSESPRETRTTASARPEVVLVSSGAIAAGLAPLGLSKRPHDLATQQAAASVGQGLLIARYTQSFARHHRGVGQVLLTADDVTRRVHYRNAFQTLTRLLELGMVPVVNENDTVATQEIRFGDNDRLAALVAHLVNADLLVLLSDVDALYDGDPRKPGARRIPEVRGPQDMAGIEIGSAGRAGVGTGGMVTKVEAARIATEAGIPVVLTTAAYAARALSGEPVGTLFHRTGKRGAARLLWLAHATAPRGSLRLDAGAVDAVVRRRLSLLAAGITEVSGSFVAGDPVELLDPSGKAVARGLVNFDAAELPPLLGRSTRDLGAELGPQYGREVVHRDDLAVLER